eukprot:SAG31_NODE_1843_length_7106_cov_7.400742_6_plen_100_part_00
MATHVNCSFLRICCSVSSTEDHTIASIVAVPSSSLYTMLVDFWSTSMIAATTETCRGVALTMAAVGCALIKFVRHTHLSKLLAIHHECILLVAGLLSIS